MGEKYFSKLVELLNLEKKKPRTTPEATGYEEGSPELAGEQRQRFATAVEVLLASQLTCPTRSDYQRLEHLVLYLKGTSGYAIHMAKNKNQEEVCLILGRGHTEHR
jgi:hypothetical protein